MKSPRVFRRRTVIVSLVFLAILGVFASRLVDIQVVKADQYRDDAAKMSTGVSQKISSLRGSIVDTNGKPLAVTVPVYDAIVDPSTIRTITKDNGDGQTVSVSWDQAAVDIAEVTGQSPDEIKKIVAKAKQENSGSQYAQIKTDLSSEQYSKLKDLNLPYLALQEKQSRDYPNGAVAGSLVGFVGSDGQPRYGLEVQENQCLSGTDGAVTYQRGQNGVMIPGTEQQKAAENGGTVKLTIDTDLQWYMQQLIAQQVQDKGALSGTITVVDVKTGKIRAAAEYPTVDPNNIDGSSPDTWRSHIFTDTFEPGSTMKAISAAMLLDTGTANALTTVRTPGRVTFSNGAIVNDDEPHPTVTYTLAGVLMQSSNVGISTLVSRMDKDTRYNYMKKMGLTSGSGANFIGEEKGFLRTPDKWDNQMTYDLSYGQGLTVTVPELLEAYDAIANGGTKIPLSLVESCTKADGTVVTPKTAKPEQVLKPETANSVRNILENVANNGWLKGVDVPGYLLAFKTGTAQKVDPATGTYKKDKYFTTLIGFAPAEDPQYLVAVTLDEPSTITSSAANADAFEKAMKQVLKTYRVLPTNAQLNVLPTYG